VADDMLVLSITSWLLQVISGTYSTINTFITTHGLAAIVALMALESASLPIPSEVILPLAGRFAAAGDFSLYLAIAASIVGTVIGITVDYAIAYVLEKEVVYKHLSAFHIKKSDLDAFDAWFAKNGAFAVFVARLLPVVRGLISLPAGFAKMSLRDFYLYSIAGSLIWNVALIMFGYWALATSNAQLMFAAIAAFAIVLYLTYRIGMKRISRHSK
jgi:membrane protein DedA with SNARE-associated domain